MDKQKAKLIAYLNEEIEKNNKIVSSLKRTGPVHLYRKLFIGDSYDKYELDPGAKRALVEYYEGEISRLESELKKM